MSEKPCGLCLAYDEKDRLVHRNDYAVCVVPSTPIWEGHTMVVPKTHVERLHHLQSNELSAYMELRDEVIDRLMELYRTDIPPLVAQNNGKWSTQPHAHEQIAPSYGHFKELLELRDFIEKHPNLSGKGIVDGVKTTLDQLRRTPKETLEEMAKELRF